MKKLTPARGAVAALLLLAAACTLDKQEAPALSGPSEFGKSITITITPDSIVQDGASQSVVTVTARGLNGEPLGNVALRAEIRVNDVATDFGSLSARNVVTSSDGRATLVYTAPPTPPGLAIDSQTVVQIGVTPLGSDFGNSVTRFATLRLVPPGRIGAPNSLKLSFVDAPNSATAEAALVFTVEPPAGATIVRYTWNFGDGSTVATVLPTVSHTYHSGGGFTVSVVAEDTIGRTGTAATTVNIGDSPAPEVDFVFSPANPVPGERVRFNASSTKVSGGRSI